MTTNHPIYTRLLSAGFFMTVCLAVAVPAHAHNEADKAPQIVVNANGAVDAAPDMAVLTMTVLREAKTARAALDENNAAMRQVIAAIKGQGIADRDLQTGRFSINPKMSYPKRSTGDRTPRLVGYTVQNTLTVRVRDLSRLGSVLDQSVSLGVNQGGSIRFTNDKPGPIIEQARAQAVKAAVAKAKTLAKAAGVGLGDVLEISERSRRQPRPVAMAQGRMMASAAAEDSVPVQAGENSYTVSVSMRWAIQQ